MNLRFVDRQAGRRRVDRTASTTRGCGGWPRRAAAIARNSAELEDWGGLPGADADPRRCRRAGPTATAGATPEQRAEGVRAVIAAADAAGVVAYGSFSTARRGARASPTRKGIRAAQRRTASQLLTVTMAPDGGSGYAEAGGRRRRRRSTPRRSGARRPTRRGRPANPVAVEPGDWPVVLEEYAVVDILSMLALHGLQRPRRPGGALVRRARQGASAASSSRSSTTATDPAALPMAFDYEGVAKQRVVARRARRLPRRRLRRPDRGPRPARRRPATACRPRTRTGRSR